MLHILALDRVYCYPGDFLFFRNQEDLQTFFRRISLKDHALPPGQDPENSEALRFGGFYDVSFSHPLTEVLATFVPMPCSEPHYWLSFLEDRPPVDACWLFQREDEDETEETYESSASFSSLFLLGELLNLYQKHPFSFACQLLRSGFQHVSRAEPQSREERPLTNVSALESDIRAFFPPDFPFRLFPFHSALRDPKNREGQAFMNAIFLWLLSHATLRF